MIDGTDAKFALMKKVLGLQALEKRNPIKHEVISWEELNKQEVFYSRSNN
jgi:hypothetical protein